MKPYPKAYHAIMNAVRNVTPSSSDWARNSARTICAWSLAILRREDKPLAREARAQMYWIGYPVK